LVLYYHQLHYRRLGRGISKFYLGDKTGACEEWRMASARCANDAAALITEYCKD
jgi:hypothetical protein